jgi:segregation and condensation protein B
VNPLVQLIEAALFSAARPLTVEELQTLDPDSSLADVRQALDQLRELYDFNQHSVEVVELGGGFQIVTRPAFAAALERAQFAIRTPRITGAAMETLAVIAYRQPVGRAEIEEIRGVGAGGVLRTLQERGIIDVIGRAETLGRPLLYGTTPTFLSHFGFRSLADLPRPDELPVILAQRPVSVG